MPHRFYLPELSETGIATLEGLEAHHLIHVLRAKAGEAVELFNGSGLVATAEIMVVRKRDAELRILDARRDPAPSRQVILGTAVPKGDRFDWLIEKATELGVARLIPLVTSRSIVDPRDSKLDKLRQTVIAACKQSGRNHLMEVSPVTAWSDFCQREFPNHSSFIAHPHPGASTISVSLVVDHSRIVFAVGPEGGFTDDEVALAVKCGATPISLGPHILRIETAGLALAACAAAM